MTKGVEIRSQIDTVTSATAGATAPVTRRITTKLLRLFSVFFGGGFAVLLSFVATLLASQALSAKQLVPVAVPILKQMGLGALICLSGLAIGAISEHLIELYQNDKKAPPSRSVRGIGALTEAGMMLAVAAAVVAIVRICVMSLPAFEALETVAK